MTDIKSFIERSHTFSKRKDSRQLWLAVDWSKLDEPIEDIETALRISAESWEWHYRKLLENEGLVMERASAECGVCWFLSVDCDVCPIGNVCAETFYHDATNTYDLEVRLEATRNEVAFLRMLADQLPRKYRFKLVGKIPGVVLPKRLDFEAEDYATAVSLVKEEIESLADEQGKLFLSDEFPYQVLIPKKYYEGLGCQHS